MHAVILGSAQDAGVPQMMCACLHCTRALADPSLRRTASAVAIVDGDAVLLLDASPDIRSQWLRLPAGSHIAGIVLTHAHAGHVAGLSMLGKEGPQLDCPLIATPAMHAYVQATPSFADGSHGMEKVHVAPGEHMAGAFSVRFHAITHRAERSDTVAVEVQAERRLLYLPDTDAWDADVSRAVAGLRHGDVVVFDATFWSADEVGHRDVSAIPHPFVEDTLPHLIGLAQRGVEVILSHLNHTNPLCDPASEASARARAAGLVVAHDGLRLPL